MKKTTSKADTKTLPHHITYTYIEQYLPDHFDAQGDFPSLKSEDRCFILLVLVISVNWATLTAIIKSLNLLRLLTILEYCKNLIQNQVVHYLQADHQKLLVTLRVLLRNQHIACFKCLSSKTALISNGFEFIIYHFRDIDFYVPKYKETSFWYLLPHVGYCIRKGRSVFKELKLYHPM